MLKFAAAAAALLAGFSVAAAAPQARAATLTVQTVTPAAGATVSGSIMWEVTVSGGIPARVEYLIDGTLKWTEGVAPYRYNGDTGSLDTKTLSDGQHTLTARAIATTGETFSTNTTINVANASSPGFAVFTSTPANNSAISGRLVWEAKMSAGAATRVDFSIDGTTKWTEGFAPFRYNGDTGTLDSTTLSNGPHTLTVHAVDAAGHSSTSSITVNVSNIISANRTVYCFGSPTYGTLGFAYDGTSLGWLRQYPMALPTRVAYDSSVSLMTGVGCQTIRAEIQPNDPDANGGTGAQRAQLYSSDALAAKYGALPSFGATRGLTRWYSFAFSTNAGYKPQNSSSYPNWNGVFTWHNNGSTGTPNIGVEIATKSQAGCGQPFSTLSTPKIAFEVNGGDPAKYPYNGATCRRWFGPAFTAGTRYTVTLGITWADNGTGSFTAYVNGQLVVSAPNISTLWINEGVYPIFENYRPGKTQIGNMITWTNSVYYGGLIVGATLADAALPNS